MNKAIITGAGGFIAKWLIKELRNNNFFVYAIKREQSVVEEWMKIDNNIILIDCEMEEYRLLPDKIGERKIDYVFHLAWQGNSKMGISNDYDAQINNIRYSMHLIEAAHILRVKRFICAGSIHEAELLTELSENKPFQSCNTFGKSSKLSFHTMGKALAAKYNIDFFNPILFYTYGEGDTSMRLIPYIIKTMLKGDTPNVSTGSQFYELLHVSDVAHAIYLIAMYGQNGFEYTICTGKTRPLKEYLLKVETLVNQCRNSDIHLNFGGHAVHITKPIPTEIRENTMLTEHTNFKQSIPFEEGIQRTLDWIISQKDIN